MPTTALTVTFSKMRKCLSSRVITKAKLEKAQKHTKKVLQSS